MSMSNHQRHSQAAVSGKAERGKTSKDGDEALTRVGLVAIISDSSDEAV